MVKAVLLSMMAVFPSGNLLIFSVFAKMPIVKYYLHSLEIALKNIFPSFQSPSFHQYKPTSFLFRLLYNKNHLLMSQTQQIPLDIREQVHTVINLLLQNGLQYQSVLSPEVYEFLQPKSKYYRYYTRELYEHGPTSRERTEMKAVKESKEFIRIQGNIENISVGAMVEIIKNELADSNRDYYQPFENETYEESIQFVHKNENISNKINEMILKHAHLIKKKGADVKEKEKEKKDHKQEEIRKEIGTYNDGSMGAYGGKKYEGLGARDEFDAFRRQKSQSYYSNLQQKSK